jgi:hypothetical protein
VIGAMDDLSGGDIFANDPDLLRRQKRAAYQKAWRLRNLEKASAIDRAWKARNSQKVKASDKARRERHPEKHATAVRAWEKRNWEKAIAYKRAWRARNLEAVKAQHLARAHIPRPETCERCGAQGLIHRHHPDYLKPLMVEFLCARCHAAVHREMRRATAENDAAGKRTKQPGGLRTRSDETKRPTTSQLRKGFDANST